MLNYLVRPDDEPAIPAVGVRAGHDRIQQLLLDAGRVLMLFGALMVIATVGNPAATTENAFLGFLLWILGASLTALMPVAGRFPRAALVGAVLASAVLQHFFSPI